MIEKLEKITPGDVLSLVKAFRGQAHNRITIRAIMGGIAVLTAPWWLEVLSVLIDWSIDLPIVDDLSKWLGFGIIIGALVYNYFMSKEILKAVVGEVAERKLNHDIKVFEKTEFDAAFITELKRSMLLKNLLEGRNWLYIIEVKDYFDGSDGKFHSSILQKASEKLVAAQDDLIQHLINADLKHEWNSHEWNSTGPGIEIVGNMIRKQIPSSFYRYSFIKKDEIETASSLLRAMSTTYDEFRLAVKNELYV
jgi:hypothetical protein